MSFEPANLESLYGMRLGYFCGVIMPLVEIKWWSGRDNATRAKTIDLVTKALCEACGCSPEAVTIIIQDVDKTSWGKAGKPYS